MKKQIVVIHGGNTFKTYKAYFRFLENREVDFKRFKDNKNDWKGNLEGSLGKVFEVIVPSMPNKTNAKYAEWKIWFGKGLPYFRQEIVLVGHSLGGVFLAKHLSENKFPKKIRATFLVAAPFDSGYRGKSLADFTLSNDLTKMEKQGGKIFLYHSKDDKIVPFADFEKYRAKLKTATPKIFSNRGHFNQEKFPELVKDIKDLY